MVKAHLNLSVGIHSQEISLMERGMGLENIFMRMVMFMKVNGTKMLKKDVEL